MGLKIIVTGGRNYQNKERVEQVLDDINVSVGVDILVHGACPTGADKLADDWAVSRNVKRIHHPAEWKRYGDSAGPRRNQDMANGGADVVIAFPGNKGTRDMKKRALAARIRVVEIEDEVSSGPLFDL